MILNFIEETVVYPCFASANTEGNTNPHDRREIVKNLH